MNLKELRDEIKRLIKINGSISSFSYQKLEGIKQTVEAVDKTGFDDFMIKREDIKLWKEIKELLKTK